MELKEHKINEKHNVVMPSFRTSL